MWNFLCKIKLPGIYIRLLTHKYTMSFCLHENFKQIYVVFLIATFFSGHLNK